MIRFVAASIASLFVVAAAACGDLVPPVPAAGTAADAAPAPDKGGNPPAVDATVPEPDASSDTDAGSDLPDGADDDDASIPPGAVLGSCDPSTWTITASDSHPVNPASYAIDGLLPTRWSTGVVQTPGQYVQIDFGGYVVLDQIVLDDSFGADDHKDYPRGLDLLASGDGTTFDRTFSSQPSVPDPGGALTVAFAPRALRAVRMQLTAGSTSWWSIHELQVGCSTPLADGGAPIKDGGAPDDSDASAANVGIARASWAATASNSGPEDPVKRAFDGDPATRWSSGKGQYGDEWFRLDLGQITSFREVWLDSNDTDFASAYQLEVSSDDVTYTAVTAGVGSKRTHIAFAPVSARYVRIKQIGSGLSYWWCIYEAAVIP